MKLYKYPGSTSISCRNLACYASCRCDYFLTLPLPPLKRFKFIELVPRTIWNRDTNQLFQLSKFHLRHDLMWYRQDYAQHLLTRNRLSVDSERHLHFITCSPSMTAWKVLVYLFLTLRVRIFYYTSV